MNLPQPAGAEAQVAEDVAGPLGARSGRGRPPVVGLGGSAGAIPALVAFLQATRPSGLAYVIVMHLAPEHDCTLAELLRRHTPMPVLQANDSVTLAANTVYIIPSGRALRMADAGKLQLGPAPSARPGRIAVDLFFRTLADSHGPHATAIVLSGMDSDGAVGIKRIKERGGLTIAQDPHEAHHDGMPCAAIATGMIDWVLPVSDMPHRISRYLELERHLTLPPELMDEVGDQTGLPSAESGLREVLALLRARTGRQFSDYKRATILRRVGRRMRVNGVRDLAAYLGCMRHRQGEADALLQELLIGVTNFFRDADCFDALEREVAALFDNRSSTDVIRVWVAACATGEEAYSIAMLLAEFAHSMETPPAVQIFATDLDERAIRVAREGAYPLTIASDVSEERLRRFFTREHDGYKLRRELREQVLFVAHDVLVDSPFSRIDLFACRNLLIHLNEDARRRFFEIAHFALSPGGRMFLGAAESADDGGPLFRVIDEKHRIYAPRPGQWATGPMLPRHAMIARAGQANLSPRTGALAVDWPSPLAGAADGRDQHASAQPEGRSFGWPDLHFKMLEALAPPSILVDGDLTILHSSPQAARYLQFNGGEPSRNLSRAIHPALRIELHAAIRQVAQSGVRAEATPLSLDLGGRSAVVRLAVAKVSGVAPGMLLVTLEELRTDASAATSTPLPGPGAAVPPSRMPDPEPARPKARLRGTIEQVETFCAELKASNEELRSMNEELRSTIEELQASRDELQSINEQLTSVNHEFKGKVAELEHADSDLQNLIEATAIATLFLDSDLRVTRFTPSAVSLFSLIPTDVGRPLAHLRNRLDYPQLSADALRVLRNAAPVEREVAGAGDRRYLARMLPSRTGEERFAGVVLTLIDITDASAARRRCG